MTGGLVDLASQAVGGSVPFANDEFFASAANLVNPHDPEWREDVFTDRGKWMDGWESRRRRQPGHDWCIVRLGIAGLVRRVVVDTTHFKGNAPEAFGLDGCGAAPATEVAALLAPDFPWQPLIPRQQLRADHPNVFEASGDRRVTHVRLRIYPDGGVARLRVFGLPLPALPDVAPVNGLPDLAGLTLGGRVEAVSDDFFSRPDHVLQPGPSTGMHDGWETRRRRDDGHDWLIVRLGLPGTPTSILVDTTHFKGNAPGWVSVDAASKEDDWTEIVPKRPVAPDRQHLIEANADRPALRVRLNLFPDGGVARFRVYGRPEANALRGIRLAYLNSLFDEEAARFFYTACGSTSFVDHMTAARPFFGTGQVLETATEALDHLAEADWLEAFATHPRIGEPTTSFWSAREQAGTAGAAADVMNRLKAGNARYEERFGLPFIVFASGMTVEEMLALLEARLHNDRRTEVSVAAEEQRRITGLRLRRMLGMELEEA